MGVQQQGWAAASPRGWPPGLASLTTPAVLVAYCMLVHALLSGMGHDATPSAALVAPSGQLSWEPMAALVEPHGYDLQEHFVTTPDGFILRIYRIPRRKQQPPPRCNSSQASLRTRHSSDTCCSSCSRAVSGSSTSQQRPVVFMQHALMDSSAGFLILGPGRSLALQLVDAGFDVFLGNSRGNRWSRNHTTLQPHQPAFWAWSWQQQAEHDLPASISYVLEATQQQRLVYIGYSQGTMTALAALSTQPRLAASISLAVLLAPVAFTTGMTSTSFVVSSWLGLDGYGLRRGWMEWGSHQPYWAAVCRHVPKLCLHFLTSFCGQNPGGSVAPELIAAIFQHLPAGTSVQNLAHWADNIRRRDSQYLFAFDYGTDCDGSSAGNSVELLSNSSATSRRSSDAASSSTPRCNEQAYGQPAPPFYNLSAITTPLALFSGGQDTISTLRDVELLKQQLQPGVLEHHQHFHDYGHLDFELGTDAPAMLYPSILQLAHRFSGRA